MQKLAQAVKLNTYQLLTPFKNPKNISPYWLGGGNLGAF
jgi:hypothetical protein